MNLADAHFLQSRSGVASVSCSGDAEKNMAVYVKPAHSVQEVNRAARDLLDPEEDLDSWQRAIQVLSIFRAAHNFPLNTFTMTLRRRAQSIRTGSLIAQRIKRLSSIVGKLAHEPEMRLSQMQDIGGCRAILPTLANVRALRQVYLDKPVTHSYLGEKDYITNPKPTGYRGIHLKYRFIGKGSSVPWNGLKVEMQLRTSLQHTWATAVEAAATFTRQALKSNMGSQEWLRFFALMSSVFALREGCPIVPGTPDNFAELTDEIRRLDADFFIYNTFRQYQAIIPHIEEQQQKAHYFLVVLDPIRQTVNVSGYAKSLSKEANDAYMAAETTMPKTTNVVLVSVSSISALKRAYPNYFLDTASFISEIALIVG